MYIPPEYKTGKSQPFLQFLYSNILPLTSTDPNVIYNPDPELKFTLFDKPFEPDMAMRIGRTPLSPSDPSTYADVSKYTEYNLRKFHSSSAGTGITNYLDRPAQPIPDNLTGVQIDGRSEVLPLGCMMNPLLADHFKPVHLTPGCLYETVDFSKIASHQGIVEPSSRGLSTKIFNSVKPKSSFSSTDNGINYDEFRQPKNNLSRNTSSFIDKYHVCDNHLKKISNTKVFLVAAHGRVISVFALNDVPNQIEVEPPFLKVTLAHSTITAFSVYAHITSSGERNIDIVFGFANGDILWLNPFRLKYSRWNKNGRLLNDVILSIEWSKCGGHFSVGFANGTSLIIGRSFEEPEVYERRLRQKHQHFKIYHSLHNSSTEFGHYKFSNKPITSMKFHPVYHNLLAFTSDDGYLRIFDVFEEKVIDIYPSYYGGFLCCEFTDDGRYLFAGGEDDNIVMYEVLYLPNGPLLRMIGKLIGSKSWVKTIKVSPLTTALRYIISAVGDDGYLRIWEVEPRQNRRVKRSVSQSVHPIPMTMSNTLTNNSNSKQSLTFFSLKKGSNGHRGQASISSLTNAGVAKNVSIFELLNSKNGTISKPEPLEKDKDEKDHILYQSLNVKIFKMAKGIESHVHHCKGYNEVVNYLPVFEHNINLGRVSWVRLTETYVWVGISTGDLIRWTVSTSV